MVPQKPILSQEALSDLDEIWLYIAQDNPTAADRVVDELYAASYKLAEFPGMGHLREDLIDEPLRFWSVYQYLIIYRPEAQPIEIVRVVSGHRDITQLLG
jgi:plasmid stabilization system protein ParE